MNSLRTKIRIGAVGDRVAASRVIRITDRLPQQFSNWPGGEIGKQDVGLLYRRQAPMYFDFEANIFSSAALSDASSAKLARLLNEPHSTLGSD